MVFSTFFTFSLNGLFTLPFSLLFKKKTGIQTPLRCFSGTPPSWTPRFPNKVAILCLCTLSLNLLACHLQSNVRPETLSYSSFLLHSSIILSRRVCFYKTKKAYINRQSYHTDITTHGSLITSLRRNVGMSPSALQSNKAIPFYFLFQTFDSAPVHSF